MAALTVSSHPPERGSFFNSVGKSASRKNGDANAVAKATPARASSGFE